MAGLEHSGPESASADLFHGAPYFLCRVKSTPASGLELMRDIATAIGATPHEISPGEHDRLVAQISHLPQILSTVLADYTSANKDLARFLVGADPSYETVLVAGELQDGA